jgi:hypothetical protein
MLELQKNIIKTLAISRVLLVDFLFTSQISLQDINLQHIKRLVNYLLLLKILIVYVFKT